MYQNTPCEVSSVADLALPVGDLTDVQLMACSVASVAVNTIGQLCASAITPQIYTQELCLPVQGRPQWSAEKRQSI